MKMSMENNDKTPNGHLNFFSHLGQAKVGNFCYLYSSWGFLKKSIYFSVHIDRAGCCVEWI